MRFKTMTLLERQSKNNRKTFDGPETAFTPFNPPQKLESSPSKFRSQFKRTIFVAATLTLLSASLLPVQACGPFEDFAAFVNEQNPDYPLRRFAAGELGIIRPGYARSYLVVAYRYLSGIKTTPDKQKEINALWERRLTNPDGKVQKAVEQWAVERKKVQSAPLKDVEVYKWDPYSSGFQNYNADSFNVATETLKSKIAKFGIGDKRVTEWVVAQDQVFGVAPNSAKDSSGSTTAVALEPLPADADAESRADRNYQIACKDFYDSRYDDAIKKFEEIANDTTSRWQKWGNYLAARAYCRKATLEDTPVISDLQQADGLIDKILSSKEQSPLVEQAKKIKQFIQYRLDPTTRAKDVVLVLTGDGANANLTEALGDYTIILDHVLEKNAESEQTPTTWNNQSEPDKAGSNSATPDARIPGQQAAGDKTTSSSIDKEFIATGVAMVAFFFAAAHLIWWRSRFKTTGTHLANAVAMLVSVVVLSCSIASCAQKANTTTTTTTTTTSIAGKETVAPPRITASQVVLDDDMSNWIMNFQDKSPQATEKAVSQWKKSNSLPWLVSAMSKITPTDSSRDELVTAANKVASDSPAYSTLAYHRIRLLNDAGKTKEASDLLLPFIKDTKNLPPSTRNALYELGVGCVGSISEFAKLAAPSPACVSAGDELLPQQVENLERAEGTGNYLVYQGCLTPQAANIINEIAPISTITALANDQTLPAKVRTDIAQAGWVRSAILKDEKSAMTLTPVLSKLMPQLSAPLNAYNAAPSGDEKEFAGLSVILHNPAMRPYVTSGLPRETAFNKIDNYRDNWWCQDPPIVNHGYDSETGEKKKDPTPTVAFLSEDEKKVGLKQYNDLTALGTAPNLFAQKVLRLAKAKPKDPRFAEVLHLVVTSTRYGCTDDNTTALSKQAFQELHKNFPGNPWTKKTKFWF